MARIGIVTDSTSSLPEELLKEYDIHIAPVSFVYEGKVYRDLKNITTDEFFQMLPGLKTPPTTSAVGPGEWYEEFHSLAKQTKQILCITISKAISASYSAAEQAAKEIKQENPGLEIRLVDSNITQAALGFIVLEAARAVKAGKSMDDVVALAEAMKPRVKYFFILETISPLQRIGRVPDSKNPEWELPFKPILGMVNNTGLVENLGKADTVDAAILQIADMVKSYADVSKPMHFVLSYSQNRAEVENLRNILESKYNITEMYFSRFTPTLLVATGPMVGLSFYS